MGGAKARKKDITKKLKKGATLSASKDKAADFLTQVSKVTDLSQITSHKMGWRESSLRGILSSRIMAGDSFLFGEDAGTKFSVVFNNLKVLVLQFKQILLPLEGGPARKLPEIEVRESKATVLYIGRIPHGFYENEMEGFFKQFGTIKRLRLARNKKTGKSKHFGFIEFESPEVAKVVADTMHNYLLFEHLLQVRLIPPEHVHPRLWKGVNRWYKPLDWVKIERKRQDKERTLEEHNKLVEGILKRDKKRRKRIEAAGIDYDCPEMVGAIQAAPKKIKFAD